MKLKQIPRRPIRGVNFSYSEAQWVEIMCAVRCGCVQPNLFGEHHLKRAARIFANDQPRWPGSARVRAGWLRVQRSLTEAHRVISSLDPNGDVFHDGGLCLDNCEGRAREPDRLILRTLNRWQKIASLAYAFNATPGDADFEYADGLTPRRLFYQTVLDLWLDSGGHLRKSRSEHSIVGGPTVRYFQAAVSPVMHKLGAKMPTSEGIVKIIKRADDEWSEFIRNDAETAVQAAARLAGGDGCQAVDTLRRAPARKRRALHKAALTYILQHRSEPRRSNGTFR
jgi:hypothetical protein